MPDVFAEQEFLDGTGDLSAEDIRTITARLDAGSRRMRAIEARLDEAERQRAETHRQLAENTEVTQQIHSVIVSARAGFKVLGLLGEIAKWLAAIAGAVLTLWGSYQAIKSGNPPHK